MWHLLTSHMSWWPRVGLDLSGAHWGQCQGQLGLSWKKYTCAPLLKTEKVPRMDLVAASCSKLSPTTWQLPSCPPLPPARTECCYPSSSTAPAPASAELQFPLKRNKVPWPFTLNKTFQTGPSAQLATSPAGPGQGWRWEQAARSLSTDTTPLKAQLQVPGAGK